MSLSTNRRGWIWIPLLSLLCVFDVPEAAVAQEGSAGDPSQWVMPNANYAGWNYSPLDQITVDNVEQLTMAWTTQLGIQDSYEASPLVIGDTMYIVTPKPNYVYQPVVEPRVAPRLAMRPLSKARRGKIPAVFDR